MRIETNGPAAVRPVEPAARAAEAEEERAQTTPRAPGEGDGAETKDVGATLGKLGEELKSFDIALHFRRDEESGLVVIDLINQTTGEKVRQIPTEAALHLSKVLGRLKGVAVDLRA